jgi:hypothetical protein
MLVSGSKQVIGQKTLAFAHSEANIISAALLIAWFSGIQWVLMCWVMARAGK